MKRNFDESSPDRYRQIPEASLKDREDEQLDEAQLKGGGEDTLLKFN